MQKYVSIYKLHPILEVVILRFSTFLCFKRVANSPRNVERICAKIAAKIDASGLRSQNRPKIDSGAVPGHAFLAPGSFLVDFGLPAGPPKSPKTDPGKNDYHPLTRPEIDLLRFLCSGAFRKGPGTDFGLPGSLPNRISEGFSVIVRRGPPGSCRGLPGSAGTLPGYTVGLRCVLGIISGMA